MKTWMKTTMVAALIATTGLAAGAALARGCGGEGAQAGKHAWHQMDPGQMQERTAARLDAMEQRLAIRAEQRQAWTDFRQFMEARMEQASERMAVRRSEGRPATALERMQRMEERGELHLEALTEMRQAAEALYSALDEAQRQTFDEQFRMGRHGPGGWGGGMRHRGLS